MKKLVSFLLVVLITIPVVAGDKPPVERKIVDQWWLAVNTMADARSLQITAEAYYIDNKRVPQATSVEELQKLVEPMYIRTTPLKDKWGTPFLYRVAADRQSYVIVSAGSDRQFDESTWDKAGYSTSSADDLVYKSGNFTREWIIQNTCK